MNWRQVAILGFTLLRIGGGAPPVRAQDPVVIHPPRLTDDGSLILNWSASPGSEFIIERASRLPEPVWEPVGLADARQSGAQWSTTVAGRSRAFYRVVVSTLGAPRVIRWDLQKPGALWTSLFADYPADPRQEALFDLIAEPRALPEELNGDPAFFLGGSNRSDDLFMALYRPLQGLAPNTPYAITLSVTLASNIPTGLFGIGGSPGDSVYVKGGVSATEPNREVIDAWWRPTVDKGNQASNGAQGVTLGTIAKPEDGNDQWVLIERSNHRKPLTTTTSADGILWIFVGTDSGFEGRTEVYFHSVTLTLSPAG